MPSTGAVTISSPTAAAAGSLTVSASSNFVNTGSALTVNGALTLNSLGLQASGPLSGSLASAVITIPTGSTFTVTQSAAGAYSGSFSGGGTLTLNPRSTAALTLAWANLSGVTTSPFTGSIIVSGGTVAVGSNNSLPGYTSSVSGTPIVTTNTITAGSITVNTGGTVAFNYNLDQFSLNSVNALSTGVVAMNAPAYVGTSPAVSDNFNDLNFSSFSGGLSLGAASNQTLYGILTPNSNTYRLGGGGGGTLSRLPSPRL